jgi:hypothetical protein
MKRHGPEDHSPEDLGMFSEPVKDARERGHRAAEAAAAKAGSIEPGWKSEALAAVREHAERHPRFLAEQIRLHLPDGADRRCVGQLMRLAEREGICTADGYAPAASSNSSMKTAWRSLIYTGEHE